MHGCSAAAALATHPCLPSPRRAQEVALDYIGKRGSTIGATRDARIQYARELLQKELLPHIGMEEFCETKKAYFFGYVVHRLLLVALGRREEDDRDHYGNKRLDLGGPLLANLFRQLFRRARHRAGLGGSGRQPAREPPGHSGKPMGQLQAAAGITLRATCIMSVGGPVCPVQEAEQGCAGVRAKVCRQGQGHQPHLGNQQGHNHARSEVRRGERIRELSSTSPSRSDGRALHASAGIRWRPATGAW